MKKIIHLAFILLVTVTVNAQRKVEKSVKVSKNQELFVHFKFAQNIEVKQCFFELDFLCKIDLLIKDDKTIMTILPETTGNKIKS